MSPTATTVSTTVSTTAAPGALATIDRRAMSLALAVGFELDIESAQDHSVFARILATLVNGTPVHLACVVESGIVVYPVETGAVLSPTTVRSCRFLLRHRGHHLTEAILDDALGRVTQRYEWHDLRLLPLTDRRASEN